MYKIDFIGKTEINFVSFVDVWEISGVCCCSEKLIDAIVKSDYLMQEQEKKWAK